MEFSSGGAAIKRLRKSKCITQEHLAALIDVAPNTVSRIERGLLMPSVETLCDICNALDTNADTILSAYIHADSHIRWNPLADLMQVLSPEKQDKIEKILDCLIKTL